MTQSKRLLSFLVTSLTVCSLGLAVGCGDDKSGDKGEVTPDGDQGNDGDDGQDGDDNQDGDDDKDGDPGQDGDDDKDGDPGQDGDDGDRSPEAARAKFESCGLLGEGKLSLESDADDACEIDCFFAASCDDLKAVFCSLDQEPDASNPYVACSLACPEVANEQFTCADGTVVVSGTVACDGFTDCDDGSDEANCGDTFACENGQEIISSWECDLFPDCEDGSDEHAGCAVLQCG